MAWSDDVSIASAPHSPYPQEPLVAVQVSSDSFNRICAPFTLSTSKHGRLHVSKKSFNRICAPFTLSTRHALVARDLVLRSFNRICAPFTLSTWWSRLIQGILRSFNRICAPFTLSTPYEEMVDMPAVAFQSHLRPIHPIHGDRCFFNEASGVVFQSHLRPIHPIHVYLIWHICTFMLVSIASAPHSPYPRYQASKSSCLIRRSFNRICAPFTLSTKINAKLLRLIMKFQSHLRPIHPIHPFARILQGSYTSRFNRICAPFTLSTLFVFSALSCR